MDHEVYCLAEGSIVLVDTGKEYHPVLGWTKPDGKEYIPMNAGDKDTRPSSYTRFTDFDIACVVLAGIEQISCSAIHQTEGRSSRGADHVECVERI